jgi:hypothetical protein
MEPCTALLADGAAAAEHERTAGHARDAERGARERRGAEHERRADTAYYDCKRKPPPKDRCGSVVTESSMLNPGLYYYHIARWIRTVGLRGHTYRSRTSELEAPYVSVNLVYSGWAVVRSDNATEPQVGRHNVHVVVSEELARAPVATLAEVFAFLGLDPAAGPRHPGLVKRP